MQRRLIVTLVLGLTLAGGLLPPFGSPAHAGEQKAEVCHVTGTGTVDGVPDTPSGHATTIAAPTYAGHPAQGDPDDSALGSLPDGREVLGAKKWVLVESVTVRADSISGATSTTVLDASGRYAFRASGLWVNVREDFLVDAEYSICQGIVRDGHPPDPAALDANWGDVRMDGKFVDWGEYSANHVYWLEVPGTGATVRFNVHDGYPNGDEPPLWYSDNSGSLNIEIFKSSDPVPDCVCPIVRRRVPSNVIADALAQPERYYGWMLPLDPNKPPSPANPPRTCLSLQHVNLNYHPLWNSPQWRVGCP